MDHQASDKKFIFNENIDKEFLFSLYQDDYSYMTEVFTTCRESIVEDIDALRLAFESGETLMLKKAAHKLKPVFGFTGLLTHQDALGQFENACLKVSGIRMLEHEYELLLQQIMEGKNIIEQESIRLKQFTGTRV